MISSAQSEKRALRMRKNEEKRQISLALNDLAKSYSDKKKAIMGQAVYSEDPKRKKALKALRSWRSDQRLAIDGHLDFALRMRIHHATALSEGKRRAEIKAHLAQLAKDNEISKSEFLAQRGACLSKEDKKKLRLREKEHRALLRDAKGRSSLLTLVRMQIKDRLHFKWSAVGTWGLIRRIVTPLLIFAVIMLISYFVFFISVMLHVFSMNATLPVRLIFVVFLFILIYTTVDDAVFLTKALYISSDNAVLVTYPVSAGKVFLSKVIVAYIYELYRSYTFVVPIFCAFAFVNRYSWPVYPWIAFTMIFVSMIPLILGVLLSLPGYYIAKIQNRFKLLKLVNFVIIAGAIISLVVVGILHIPDHVSLVNSWTDIYAGVQNALLWASNSMRPLYNVIMMMFLTGGGVLMNFLTFAAIVGIIAALVALAYLIARFMFFRMISASFDGDAKSIAKIGKNHSLPRWLSIVHNDFKVLALSGGYVYSLLAIDMLVPVLILFMNRIFGSMDISTFGDKLIVVFDFLMVLLPMLSGNSLIASIYSREGAASYIKKTEPVSVLPVLLSKLVPVASFGVVSIAISFLIIGLQASITPANAVWLALCACLIYLGHMLWSAQLDLLNPFYEAYSNSAAIENPNENNATILAFLISGFATLVFYLFLSQDTFSAYYRIVAVSVLFFASASLMFVKYIRAYYFEVRSK